ncbi:MAG TPA: glycosyltransferase family 4 protein [Sphingomicrobium sp.]|nr:glycosyltransferase family 4 protein [Sphingomicrobium sp.]
MPGKTVVVLGSYAPSLVLFRGPLIAALAARGHRVVASAPTIGPDTAAELRRLGAEPRELPLSNAGLNPVAMVRSLRALKTLLLDVRPDVLLSYTIKPVILGALAGRAAGVPAIISLITGVGYAFTEGGEARRRIVRMAASPLYRMALARSTAIVFQNPDDETLFRELGLVPRRASVHRVNGSGIDLDRFEPVPLPAGTSFLMIARLLKDKGIREFAMAAKRIRADHPEVPIALVGRLDPSPDSLTSAELDDLLHHGIEFKGELSDVRPAISGCSVYVLPSYREGTPRSVLEAMAMGRAIVTTDAPGCRETVVDGKNGLLVPPRDAGALHDAMLRFVREPGLAGDMGRASRRLAEEKFDVRTVNSSLLGIAGL